MLSVFAIEKACIAPNAVPTAPVAMIDPPPVPVTTVAVVDMIKGMLKVESACAHVTIAVVVKIDIRQGMMQTYQE